jgi:exodeoxyribonuclease V gamma subunit
VTARPERPWTAATIGKVRKTGGRRARITVARIPPLAGDAHARRALALAELEALIELYDRGMREIPPLACMASAAYAAAMRAGKPALKPATDAWESGWTSRGWVAREDAEPEHVLVHGGIVPFSALMADVPRDDERGPGWDEGDPTRFGRWARRLWTPLLDREAVEDR